MKTFSLIGCGKVGSSLARRLVEKGFRANYIFNRTADKATQLSREIGGQPVTELKDVCREEHWIIISVSDDRVVDLSKGLSSTHALVTHTSGVLSPNAISQSRKGYFYPLQSFSSERSTDWSKVPLFIEAEIEEDRKTLRDIAVLIGGSVHEIDAEQKKHLHLAAVFINNFTNHMLVLAEQIAQEKQLDFSIFHALLQETVDKAIAIGPRNAQTGPAIRGDEKTIEQHISRLPEKLKEMYRLITNDIQRNK